MAEINKRIAKIRHDFCDASNAVFAEKLGKSVTYSSQLCKGGTLPSEKMIDHILSVFPAVSKSWLMLGEGDMLASSKNSLPTPLAVTQTAIPDHVLHLYDSLLKEKDETISTLRDTIKTLTTEIEQLQNYVSLTSSKYINVMERMMYTTNETATIAKLCSSKMCPNFSEKTNVTPKM